MIKCYGNMDSLGILSIKLATASLVVIILKLWSGSIAWILRTNIWWFVLAFAIFVIRAGMGSKGNGQIFVGTKKPVVKKKTTIRKKK